MKKFALLTFIFFVFGSMGFAQVEKGKYLIIGNSHFKMQSQSSDKKINGFDYKPNEIDIHFKGAGGYYILDGLAVGLGLKYHLEQQQHKINNTVTQNSEDYEPVNLSSFSISPMARYYFMTGNIKPFVQGEVGYGMGKDKGQILNQTNNTTFSKDDKFNVMSFGGSIGGAWFFHTNISAEVSINYYYEKN